MTELQVLLAIGLSERQARIMLARSHQPLDELQRKVEKARRRCFFCQEDLDLARAQAREIVRQLERNFR